MSSVGLPSLLNRLDEAQKDEVPPFLAIGVARKFMGDSWLDSPGSRANSAQPFQSAEEQADGGGGACGRFARNVGHREALQVVQLITTRRWSSGSRAKGGARAEAVLRRGRPLHSGTSGRPRASPPTGRTIAPVPPPGIVPGRDPGLGAISPDHGRQGIRQDGAEPGLPLAFGRTLKLRSPPLVGVQDRPTADDVGGVSPLAEQGTHLEPDEQQEIIAVILNRADLVVSIKSHGFAPGSRQPSVRSVRVAFL